VAQLHGFEVVRHSQPIAWVSALDDPSSGSRSPPPITLIHLLH
jgi:hypothetical protein